MSTIKSSPIAVSIGHLSEAAKNKAITKYLEMVPSLNNDAERAFHALRTMGFVLTMDGASCYVHAIGFDSHTGVEYLFNQFDQRYDNADKIDLIQDGHKYSNPVFSDARRAFKKEGCIGDLAEMLLPVWTPETDPGQEVSVSDEMRVFLHDLKMVLNAMPNTTVNVLGNKMSTYQLASRLNSLLNAGF